MGHFPWLCVIKRGYMFFLGCLKTHWVSNIRISRWKTHRFFWVYSSTSKVWPSCKKQTCLGLSEDRVTVIVNPLANHNLPCQNIRVPWNIRSDTLFFCWVPVGDGLLWNVLFLLWWSIPSNMASLGRIENIPNKQKSLGRIWHFCWLGKGSHD